MTLKLPPRFVNMPAGTVFDAHLPDALFRTLAQLHGLAWQTKGERTPPATVAEFARLRGLKERRMYDHLRELKEQGFIRVENLGHNRIVIFPLRWEPGTALPTGDDTPTDENTRPLRWASDTALSPSAPDVTGTAMNCNNSPGLPDFTAKNCSSAAKDCSSCRSSCFKNTESDSDSKKQQRQQTNSTAKNCSEIPPDFQPLLDLLVERCGTPAKIAREAVEIAVESGDDPTWLQRDVLRWLAYCQSDYGKTILVPGIFIARKVQHAQPCPEFFQTDYSHPLHGEIRELEMQLE